MKAQEFEKIVSEVYREGEIKRWQDQEPTSYWTAEDIARYLQRAMDEKDEFVSFSSIFDWGFEGETDKWIITTEDTEGGGEGDGEYMHTILKFVNKNTKEETLVKWVGCHNSWDSDYWDEAPEIVEARKVEVTQYFTKEK